MLVCIFLTAFLCLNAVCASEYNQTDEITTVENQEIYSQSIDEENIELNAINDENNSALSASDANVLAKSSEKSVIETSSKASSPTVFVKNSNFNIQILDGDGNPIKNKTVSVKFNDKLTKLTTNARGFVFYKLDAVGTYTLTYSFKASGYAPIKVSKKISVVSNTASKLKGSNYVAYVGVKNPFTVTLTTGGVNLPNQKVVFTFKGKKYTRTTDSKGVATFNINTAKKGTYTIKYSFKAVKNAKSASGKAKITVKKGMPTSITNQKIYVYRPNVATPFVIKYRDLRGDPIASKTIEFTINKKTYKVKTDSKGLAQVKIKQKRGSYTLKVRSYNTAAYIGVTNTYSIRVIPEHVNYDNYGFWLFGGDMKKVNLKTMAKNGINHIFLNFYSVDLYGKSSVSSFAKEAKSLGIKVHMWMQVFYRNGGWVSPVYDDGSYKYSLFNSIIKEAKDYAKIDGISGIHLDYLRFPGTAYRHANGMEAINYFTQKICSELHAMNSNLIVSAAVMPEPSSMKYYYGQDIATISKYLDVIVPMVYKGNYNQGASWVKSITSTFVGQSKGAEIWTGLQSYYSDSNVQKLPASTLRHDAVYGISGGATGIILFRYTLFNLFDFATL